MNYTYQLHALAMEDYSEAYAWYENREPGLGERFVTSVRLQIDDIIQNPEIFGSRENVFQRSCY